MDDEYQPTIPLPGIRLGAQAGAAWRRAFAGWRPDARSVGVLLVALYLGILLERLLTVDLAWRAFTASIQSQPILGGIPWQQAVGTTMQLLGLPVDALVVLGGAGLALRRGWGRPVALSGLASLLTIALVDAVVYLSRGPMVREGVAQLAYALGTALPVAVLLWSRAPEEDG